EQQRTVERLERRYELEHDGKSVDISHTDAQPGVLYGYAFNISKCEGYRECVRGCVEENNQDRDSNMQYIRIFEKEHGSMNLHDGEADYFHEVPAEGHFYMGTQCFQCENPP
ncbi:MAG: 4Fe-4S dicluster domain-containing protein, partial [bacterium]